MKQAKGCVLSQTEQSLYWEIQMINVTSPFTTSRLVSKLLIVESWYWDWNQEFEYWYGDWNWDFQILSLVIETGNATFKITVLILRLVMRLKKQGGIPVIETLARVTAHLWPWHPSVGVRGYEAGSLKSRYFLPLSMNSWPPHASLSWCWLIMVFGIW